MLYEGQTENGLECFKSIRDRFDGYKRNPYDEPECGHHYARAMASWASVIAISGFHYSGIEKSMSFTSKPGDYFWSNGYAWGTCKVEGKKATLNVLYGKLELSKFTLADLGSVKLKNLNLSANGTSSATFKIK